MDKKTLKFTKVEMIATCSFVVAMLVIAVVYLNVFQAIFK